MVGLADWSGGNVLRDSRNVHGGLRGSLRRSDSLIKILWSGLIRCMLRLAFIKFHVVTHKQAVFNSLGIFARVALFPLKVSLQICKVLHPIPGHDFFRGAITQSVGAGRMDSALLL
jgi:hypothetical protein